MGLWILIFLIAFVVVFVKFSNLNKTIISLQTKLSRVESELKTLKNSQNKIQDSAIRMDFTQKTQKISTQQATEAIKQDFIHIPEKVSTQDSIKDSTKDSAKNSTQDSIKDSAKVPQYRQMEATKTKISPQNAEKIAVKKDFFEQFFTQKILQSLQACFWLSLCYF